MAGVADCFPGYATRDAVVGVLADWGGFVLAGVANLAPWYVTRGPVLGGLGDLGRCPAR